MRESIHQSYRNLLEEMHAESINCGAATLREPFSDSIYFPTGYFKSKRDWTFESILLCILFSALIVCGVLYYFRHQSSAAIAPVVTLNSPLEPVNKKTEALEAELDLMKKILVGLVESVQSLSKEPRQMPTPENEPTNFPFPVKVTVERAHLRAEADRAGKSLGAVPKDTVLLATEEKDGWVKVSTPKGEDAWISHDVITEKGN
jgi:Bacterial SH3 domain